jgi:polysaccharide biosynthesis protein VpsJ
MAALTPDEVASEAAEALRRAREVDWRSHDPFDVLLSPLAAPIRRSLPLSRVAVQLGKRGGRRLRRVLRVPVHLEAKALADLARAARMLERRSSQSRNEDVDVTDIPTLLEQLAVRTERGVGWGLAFPYASRFGFLPSGAPNIYTTINVCHALLDVERSGQVPQLVVRACAFMRGELDGLEYGGRRWFRYSAGGTAPIVNVQASAADLLSRVATQLPDEAMMLRAAEAVAVVVEAQNDDGSWPYSLDGRGAFVDGFHTGFTLEGLLGYGRRAESDEAVDSAVAQGWAFFRHALITAEGEPRGFARGPVSNDPQNAAQCVQTLARGGDLDAVELAGSIWRKHLVPVLRRPANEAMLRWETGPTTLASALLAEALAARGTELE